MKRLYFAFFAAIVLSTALRAQNNNLVIYSQDGLKFTVILNGIRQNPQPETNVKITGLNAPNYSMKIIFANGLPDIDQNVFCMDGGSLSRNTEFSNAIVYRKGRYKLRFASVAPIAVAAPQNPHQTVLCYNSGIVPPPPPVCSTPAQGTSTTNTVETTTTNVGLFGVSTTTTTTTTTTSGNGNNGYNGNGHGHNDPNGNMRPNDSHNPAPRPANANPDNRPYTMPGYNGVYGCPMPMSPADFESAKKSIKSKGFDDTRLTLAKQIIGSNCLLCSQIKELMELMSFEDTKLDLAKFAWTHNLDRGNYYQLNDAFHFSSSIDELNKYTESH